MLHKTRLKTANLEVQPQTVAKQTCVWYRGHIISSRQRRWLWRVQEVGSYDTHCWIWHSQHTHWLTIINRITIITHRHRHQSRATDSLHESTHVQCWQQLLSPVIILTKTHLSVLLSTHSARVSQLRLPSSFTVHSALHQLIYTQPQLSNFTASSTLIHADAESFTIWQA